MSRAQGVDHAAAGVCECWDFVLCFKETAFAAVFEWRVTGNRRHMLQTAATGAACP